jgi:hypothetical protein
LSLDSRIGKFRFKVAGLRPSQPDPASAWTANPPQGRCLRSVQPDGRPFWSYTWQQPAQNVVPQRDDATPRLSARAAKPEQAAA